MARHRSFSFEFKRQPVSDILEGRLGMREIARKHSLSRNLTRLFLAQRRRLPTRFMTTLIRFKGSGFFAYRLTLQPDSVS
jgi:transposase-like protein